MPQLGRCVSKHVSNLVSPPVATRPLPGASGSPNLTSRSNSSIVTVIAVSFQLGKSRFTARRGVGGVFGPFVGGGCSKGRLVPGSPCHGPAVPSLTSNSKSSICHLLPTRQARPAPFPANRGGQPGRPGKDARVARDGRGAALTTARAGLTRWSVRSGGQPGAIAGQARRLVGPHADQRHGRRRFPRRNFHSLLKQ